jgi:hypothetical protein
LAGPLARTSGARVTQTLKPLAALPSEGIVASPSRPVEQEENASLAQLVEQLICNQQVVGSSPTTGSIQNE